MQDGRMRERRRRGVEGDPNTNCGMQDRSDGGLEQEGTEPQRYPTQYTRKPGRTLACLRTEQQKLRVKQ